jgi:hypothetical protein
VSTDDPDARDPARSAFATKDSPGTKVGRSDVGGFAARTRAAPSTIGLRDQEALLANERPSARPINAGDAARSIERLDREALVDGDIGDQEAGRTFE